MTEAHAHHGNDTTLAPGEKPYFSHAEWEEFEKDDIHAGRAIILLMAGIFGIGLVLYTTITFLVA